MVRSPGFLVVVMEIVRILKNVMVAKCCMVDKEQECEAQERESEIVRPDQTFEEEWRVDQSRRRAIEKKNNKK